ncbi:LOW QUALITY PROTEIN: highly divergent homeobox-like [Sinocyclocheilus rhinocerous]|uniref:LOW QUALITY PROTEIN: highly divergent homeobox-like n=1 Tax=Sinocyclocheilus rhinocerous TaxID=307959 RepID=UPI0007BAA07F|nr:PREDICTED: LOW QUALITY PROTEIN: highly divergent homeobox-like [Sinocyclocheilus rhinocerous]
MEKWLEKRSIHTMNLRSVFTAEQQRILERYYECGMINQSKSCFQLILQCAQETKLDFSVVRTWVGNKRRKLASKADQNGAGAQALSHQHVSCGSAGALVAGSVLTAEIAAMRSIQRGPPVTHLLPPQASSSSSSSSPLSDVILMGIYANCFDATVHNRTVTKSLPSHAEMEPPAVQRKSPIIPGGSSVLKCSQTLKPFPSRDVIAPSGIPCLKVTSDVSAPWLHSNSRKRTLQDRTQFSDRDVYTLKRYWDKGMTSLGSLCKEKISAAACELSVDTEIIKTWIGNRRRKYRLMGIEIPPPKGGPVMFPNHSPLILEDERQTPELGEASEHNDLGSLCLSDDGASDLYLKENDDVNDESDGSTPAKHVKIEIVDEEEDDDEGDMLTTEMEQMQNLLEFRNEEVQFLENELRSQKQKFSKLKSFTKSLLIAVRNKDRKKQQELLASLPQKVNEDWDLGLENHRESGAEMPTIQKESSVSEEEEDMDQMRL